MALASTSFMAAPGGFSATLANKLDKIDCSQVLAAVLLADKELLGHIKVGGAVHNLEHNWIEDELNAAYVIASISASNAMTVTTPATTASLQRVMRKYAIVQPAGAEFAMNVTATISKMTLTIAKYASTTWADTTATKCYILGMPWADIDDASYDTSKARSKRKNFTQVFERVVQITESRQGMDMEAVTNELSLQTDRRTMEIKRELDMAVIRGMARISASNTFSADNELRTMAGIIQCIRDYDLDTSNEDDTVTQVSAALTIAALNSLCNKIYDQGGLDDSSDPIIVVGAKQARVIASWESELRRVEQGERTVGYYRNIFLSDLGQEFPVVLDRWMPNDKLIILDRSRITLMPLQGDAWHLTKLAKTGRSDKWQLSGQYTIELRNADKCHGLLWDLS